MFCQFRSGQHHFLAFSTKCMSLYNTAFSAGDQHVLTFSHWPHHFSAIFSKGISLSKTALFCPGSARFLIFALAAPLLSECTSLSKTPLLARDQHVSLFSDFQQSTSVCAKQCFQPEISALLLFLRWAHHFLALFSKVHEFVQNSFFSRRSPRFNIFALSAPLFYSFQQSAFIVFSNVNEFVQNSIFSPRSACFVIFALGALLFSDFQQRARSCGNQRFQPKISTFCHSRTGCTTF